MMLLLVVVVTPEAMGMMAMMVLLVWWSQLQPSLPWRQEADREEAAFFRHSLLQELRKPFGGIEANWGCIKLRCQGTPKVQLYWEMMGIQHRVPYSQSHWCHGVPTGIQRRAMNLDKEDCMATIGNLEFMVPYYNIDSYGSYQLVWIFRSGKYDKILLCPPEFITGMMGWLHHFAISRSSTYLELISNQQSAIVLVDRVWICPAPRGPREQLVPVKSMEDEDARGLGLMMSNGAQQL